MSSARFQMAAAETPAPERMPGKPRIAIMGEFSAGKSTLSNMLLGRQALPIKVTATQLPPVWISFGEGTPYRRGLDGAEEPIEMDEIEDVSPSDTEFIRIFHQTDTLQMFDLIDFPGISDPNMPAEVWQRVLGQADAVIWCTHATQAWRQSEAAVWEEFADRLADKSLLLVTRFDKIVGARDRTRVLTRLKHETDGLFRAIYPISLTEALQAEQNFDLWETSGAEAFASALIDLSQELVTQTDQGTAQPQPVTPRADNVSAFPKPAPTPPEAPPPATGEPLVMPRRVDRPVQLKRRVARPARDDGETSG